MSSDEAKFENAHKRTPRVNECQLVTAAEGEVDPIVEKLGKIGCLEQHYKVQDCYFETKDWRKCTQEVKEFQACLSKARKEANK